MGPFANLCACLYIYDWRHVLQLDLLGQNCLYTFPSEQIQLDVSRAVSPSLVLLLWHGEQVGHDVAPVRADPEGGRRRLRGLEERASEPETTYQRSVLWDSSSLGQTGLWRQDLQIGSQCVHNASNQGGITCGAIDEPRKSSKAIDERVIINFRDKIVVIARFRDKNVYR